MLGCETSREDVRDGARGEVYTCTKGCVACLWEGLRVYDAGSACVQWAGVRKRRHARARPRLSTCERAGSMWRERAS